MAKSPDKKDEAPEPNIVLTARDKDNDKIDISRAIERINTGSVGTIKLPPREEQDKPFYHEDAENIIAAMPHLYKTFKSQGSAKKQ